MCCCLQVAHAVSISDVILLCSLFMRDLISNAEASSAEANNKPSYHISIIHTHTRLQVSSRRRMLPQHPGVYLRCCSGSCVNLCSVLQPEKSTCSSSQLQAPHHARNPGQKSLTVYTRFLRDETRLSWGMVFSCDGAMHRALGLCCVVTG